MVLAHDWTSLDEQIATGIHRYLADIKKAVDKVIESATSTCSSDVQLLLDDIEKHDLGNMAPRGFIDNMRARKTHLRYLLQNEFIVFKRKLGVTIQTASNWGP